MWNFVLVCGNLEKNGRWPAPPKALDYRNGAPGCSARAQGLATGPARRGLRRLPQARSEDRRNRSRAQLARDRRKVSHGGQVSAHHLAPPAHLFTLPLEIKRGTVEIARGRLEDGWRRRKEKRRETKADGKDRMVDETTPETCKLHPVSAPPFCISSSFPLARGPRSCVCRSVVAFFFFFGSRLGTV